MRLRGLSDSPSSSLTKSSDSSMGSCSAARAQCDAILEQFFADTKINYVPLHLTSTISRKRTFGGEERQTYHVDITLLTLPKQSATFIVTEPVAGVPYLDPKSTTTDSIAVTMNAGTCHSDRPCDWSRDFSVPMNKGIVNVRYDCTGQCGWCYSLRHGGYGIDYDLLNNRTKATVYRHCDGDAQATTVTHYFDYQTLKTDTTQSSQSQQGIAFNESRSIDLSPQNTACTYQIAGKLITGQVINEDANNALSNGSLLQATGMPVRFGDHCKLMVTLHTP